MYQFPVYWTFLEIFLNVEKTKVMRISRQPLPVKIIVDQKQLKNVESFKYLGSILTNDERCTCEIKCRIAMAKAAFNKKRTLFTRTLGISYMKYVNGRRTGLVTFWVETAFYNGLLKERYKGG
jgi:hypothetical protein